MRIALPLVVCALPACYSGVGLPSQGDDGAASAASSPGGSGDDGASDGGGDTSTETPAAATHGGLRRLSVGEYDNAVRDLIGDASRPGAVFLPGDALTPFDNEYAQQTPSEALVAAAEKVAIEAGQRLLGEPAKLEELAGCVPTGVEDADCLRGLITRLGRKAFRRPLTAEEVDEYASLLAKGVEAESWHVAAAAVVRGMLQDPNFLYRVEIGEPVPGNPEIVALTDWEIATRLSFFLWRTIPDDALLDLAEDGKLSNEDDVRAAATQMLLDERSREGMEQFHSLWLGFAGGGTEGIRADMVAETNALVRRVVFEEEASWLSLFTSTETFLTPALAEHYGLPAPEGDMPGWVEYGESGRGGLLSHGAVLAWGAKFGDTSPTTRGKEIRERLFCQPIPPPPPGQNTDDPPGGDEPDGCKIDHYAKYREGGCGSCHSLMDGIGFGLENYGADGTWRANDVGKPECEITGDGEVAGVGAFNGPAGLGDLMLSNDGVRACALKQLYRYVSGRAEPDELDAPFLQRLSEMHNGDELNLRALMLDIASSDEMRFRVLGEGE